MTRSGSTLLRTLAAVVLASLATVARGDATPKLITWEQLIPEGWVEPEVDIPLSLDPTAPPQDSSFMSKKIARPEGVPPAPVVETMNGKLVKLGGYVVPLDFEATTVKEFLLVPFIGACIHVPPPPANQIIYVTIAKGFEVGDMWEPVTVIGTLKTTGATTGLADTGYSMDADSIDKTQ